jgi:hypothetical protein
MKKLILCFLLMFLMAETSWAQLNGAPFSSSTGTYTEITGGTVLGSPTDDSQMFTDPAKPLGGTAVADRRGPGFPIGFNFTFDGVVYDRFAINTNGWVSFGQSALGVQAVWNWVTSTPISAVNAITTLQLVARVSAVGCDLAGQTGSQLMIKTVGTAPNRECVIQWKGYRVWTEQPFTGDNLNFQIRLVETTNQVKIVYGQMTTISSNTAVQVGLRDKPATSAVNYSNRALNPVWANTVAGTAAVSTCTLSSTVYPPSGLTYTYGPLTACSGIPNPGNTIATPAQVCLNDNFTLSLQNLTPGYNVTYQWQSSPTNADPWTNLGTDISITTSQAAVKYYRCQVTCSGNTTISNPAQVNTAPYCGYCLPTYSSSRSIDNVMLVNLWPLSQSMPTRLAAYNNYIYTQNAIPNIARGQAFNLNLKFNDENNQYFGVWIDFNQNIVFETTEYFSTGTNAGALGEVILPITVPAGATLGLTRMRIRGGDDLVLSPSQACGASNDTHGNGQDYLVNITEPSTLNGHVYDANSNPIAGATIAITDRGTATTNGSGYYSWQVPSGQNRVKCSKPGYNGIELILNIPASSTVTQDFMLTDPEMAVTPNSLFMVLSSSETGTTNVQISNNGSGVLGWYAKVNYNVNRNTDVVYCPASDVYCSNSSNANIARVILNTINNASGCYAYSDYTAISTTLVPGITYTIYLTEGGSPTSSDQATAWIDWDQDGQWDEAPIIFTGTPPNLSGTFIVPKDVMQGSTRLRIRLQKESPNPPQACGTIIQGYGEVEDYTVNVVSWLTLDNYAGTVPSGGTGTIPVHINAMKAEDGNPGLPGQTYISELEFNSDPDAGSITIPITLAITDPDLPAPSNLMAYIINSEEGLFQLRWNYPETRSTRFDHFVIMRNGEVYATTTSRFYKETLVTPDEYCYKVYAHYSNGAYSDATNEVCITYPVPPGIPLAGWAIALGALLIAVYAFIMIRRRM